MNGEAFLRVFARAAKAVTLRELADAALDPKTPEGMTLRATFEEIGSRALTDPDGAGKLALAAKLRTVFEHFFCKHFEANSAGVANPRTLAVLVVHYLSDEKPS